jgi:hypothetical protein
VGGRKIKDQGHILRLETRAREFRAVASLRGLTPQAKGNQALAADASIYCQSSKSEFAMKIWKIGNIQASVRRGVLIEPKSQS